MFMKWIKEFAKFYKHSYIEGNTNGERWFEVTSSNTREEKKSANLDEIPF